MQRIFILLSLAFLSFQASGQVVINEYSCSNLNGPVDAFGDREDWVELLNTGASSINLSGYYLSDDKNDVQKWQIPAGVNIAANGRVMVYCSDRGVVQAGQLHPSFKLTQTRGEYFVIANAAGTIVDSVKLIPAQANHSRGRKTDGGAQWGIFDTPTPNAANVNAKDAYATKPVFSVAPGFYPAAQNVAITSPDPNVQIRYTTDGTIPTPASTLYAAPVAVPVTMVVRAIAFSSTPGILPSFTETNTYLINENTTMSVVSVAGNYTSLFTSWGGNRIQTSVEYFDRNKQFRFELEGHARPHGHDSWAYQQKGFKLQAKDQFGYDHAMKHKFFTTSPKDTFDLVILKAGASDNYPGNVGNPGCHLRDAFAHTLSYKYGLDMDGRKYEPAIVFINGTYWGIYEIRERVDEEYFEYYYGQTEKKVDHLSYWGSLEVRSGSDSGWNNLYNYITTNSMAVQANYEHVKDYLNVESFIQYFIYNTWLVNSDWLNWNTMWWRGRKGQGVKWRYALWDMDNIMDLGQNFTGLPTTTFQNDPCNPFDLFQGSQSIKHTTMLTRLMQNTEFDQLYRNIFIDMLNGPLNCDNMIPHFDSIVNIIQPEMQRHCNRWAGTYSTWEANVLYMRSQILGRCQVIGQKLDSCMDLNPQKISFNVSPSNGGTIEWDGNTVSPYVWSRIIDADSLLNLSATPNTAGYYLFDHWEKYEAANSYTPDSLTNAVGFNFHKKDSVVAFFKYFNPDSIYVTFDVTPATKGNISLNSAVIGAYPYTVKLDRKYAYALLASPTAPGYKFFGWRKNKSTSNLAPDHFNPNVTFTFTEEDTIVANFQYDPSSTTTLPTSPDLPVLNQEMSVPTAFTPNGDGKNDVFSIRGQHVSAMDMRIYDRWGNLVFKSNDPKIGWDGTYKDQPAEIGTYFYVVTVWYDNALQNANKTYKGDINLIR